jgi:pimeloyl-ACP methyl ester carboxylesterase
VAYCRQMSQLILQKKFLYIFISVIVLWFSICVAVRLNVNQIVFHPLKKYYTYEGIPSFTQYFATNSLQQKIDLKYYEGQKSDKLVIYFHGNGGFSTPFLRDLIKQGNVLVPSYPGYLESEGNPTVDNFYEIGDLAYQKALELGYNENQIVLWGHSLGGSMAAYTSSKHPDLSKTILINTFNNLQGECEKRFYIVCIFGGGLLPSDQFAAQIQGKVRQFHNRDDTTIDMELGQKLYNSIGSKDKKFTTFETGDHNNFDISRSFED